MPGIVGIFSADELSLESEQSFQKMAESLRHTAAQKLTTYRRKSLLLGRADLGIFRSNIEPRETDDLIAFIWGELINIQEERKELLKGACICRRQEEIDDIDFILGLFSKRRSDFASFLRGSFNAFIVDKRYRTLTIVSDRFGFRPLYYHLSGNELVFASEVKAILNHKRTKKVVDTAGLADFFHFGFVTGEKTFFEGIEMFPAGATGVFEKWDLKIKRYWSLAFTENQKENGRREGDHIQELATAIQDSVRANAEGEFRFGLPLSGGLDSRTIAACIPRNKYPVPIYTWGMPGSREVRIAKKVAETLGLAHRSLHRTPEEFVENFEKSVIMTDGMIPANLPLVNFLYERAFAPDVDICLDGMQAICAVYPINSRTLNHQSAIEQVIGRPHAEALRPVLADSSYERFKELAALSGEQLKASMGRTRDPIDAHQFLDITQKQRRLDNFGVLVKRNFVEVRSPLFDYPVVDVVQSIPATLRKQRYIYYKAFTYMSPELAKITNVATMRPVSAPHWLQMVGRIAKGVKPKVYRMFYENTGINYNRHKLCDWGIDYGCWYKESTAIKVFMREVLSRERIKRCEHLNPKGVEEILDAQTKGRRNHAEVINRLMTYAIWSKNFL